MHCGVGDYTSRLATALAERGDVHLKVLTSQATAPVADPAWLCREMPNWRLRSLVRYVRVLRQFRPDIVHAQYPTRGYSVATGPASLPTIARAHRACVVQTWHEYPPSSPLRAVIAMLVLAASADALVYVRPDYEKRLHGLTKKFLGRTPRHFVPNGSIVPGVQLSRPDRAALREKLGCSDGQLIAYFGFAYPHKGIDRLFEICDARRHHIVIMGELQRTDPYHRAILALAESSDWRGRVTLTGFVDPLTAAQVLAAADAAVFPFLEGGGIWNSSVHAALAQGTFTMMTSWHRSGYVADENVYYAKPGDVEEMRRALDRHIGNRRPARPDEWRSIAERHVQIYREAQTSRARHPQ